MDIKLNSTSINFREVNGSAFLAKITETYQKFFEYSPADLTLESDLPIESLNKLNYAWLRRSYVLITFNNEQQVIAKVKKITATRQIVLAPLDSKIVEFIPLNQIFKVEFAER